MILGIGADLCRIDRIRRSLERFGEDWIDESFRADEKAHGLVAPDPGCVFAAGFSCKEACAKALGTGFAKGVHPRDIQVVQNKSTVTISLHGAANKRVRRMTPHGYLSEFLVTVTGDGLLVCSLVVLQTVLDA